MCRASNISRVNEFRPLNSSQNAAVYFLVGRPGSANASTAFMKIIQINCLEKNIYYTCEENSSLIEIR